MRSSIFGYTALGLPQVAYDFGDSSQRVLILGGVHGDEVEGVWAALKLVKEFSEKYPFKFQTTVIPMFNPEGVINKTRQNSRGVDLNRNLPTRDWSPEIANPRYHPGPQANSEPENHGLISFLDKQKPIWVLSLHSWQPCMNINGECRPQAEAMEKINGYRITEDIGYPTPGSLGSLGLERKIPVMTYEIERGLSAEKVLQIHPKACIKGLESLK